MTNITRTDPLQELTRWEPFRDIDTLMPWSRFRRWLQELPGEAMPLIKVDVAEDDKAYHVKADLPGVKKEDIAVEIEGNQVSITAEMKREIEEKKGETLVHSERYYGKQYRSFTLNREIDRKGAEAKFTDGVLELTLPKGGAEPSKRIEIR